MRYFAIFIASFLFAAFGVASAKDDTRDEAVRKDLKSLAGTWNVTSRETNGEKAPADVLKGMFVKVTDDGTATVTKEGKEIHKAKWTNMDPTQKTKTVDLEVVDGDEKGKIRLGIYRVEGDQLTLCVANAGKDRPETFSAGVDSGQTLMTCTRKKDE
jgi:uncharacterized protein (TIGR03067 family)